jgi:class 3 adenylate cyclase/pimeloyl-ACP methyl ester carboxylesterase
MEPRIQYTKTSDGVDIAFATAGDGPPLLMMAPPPQTHVQAAWDMFPQFHALAECFHVVWYDSRGSGLSDRDAIDFSMDAMLRDLEAVVDGAGLLRFAMAGILDAAPIAVAYAATRREQISSLVIADGWVKFSDWRNQNPFNVAEEALRSGDWTLYTETLTRVLLGIEDQEFAVRYAAYIRECVEPEAYRSSQASMESWDVSALLPQIIARTLVVHNRNNRTLSQQVGQRMAARIPNARFQLIDDTYYLQLPSIITAFVGESGEITQRQIDLPSGTAVILFVDIADSTALTERLGDAAFREKARALDGSLRRVIRESGGTPIEGKVLGDGVMAVFASAREAIEGAMRCREEGRHASLPLHLGIHAGDVIRETDPDGRGNVYGGAVNIAARVAGESAAGEILVSDIVRGLARTSAGVTFEDRGEHALKGVADPQRLFAVRTRDV